MPNPCTPIQSCSIWVGFFRILARGNLYTSRDSTTLHDFSNVEGIPCSQVCMPVKSSQTRLCSFSISSSYMSAYDKYITPYTCSPRRLFQGSVSQLVGQKNQSLGRFSSPTMSDVRDKPRTAPSCPPYVTSSMLLSASSFHRLGTHAFFVHASTWMCCLQPSTVPLSFFPSEPQHDKYNRRHTENVMA